MIICQTPSKNPDYKIQITTKSNFSLRFFMKILKAFQAFSSVTYYRTRTLPRTRKSVQKCDKSQAQIKLLTTFLLLNCLCLIKICAYSHVSIIQIAVIDYQIEVTLMSIFILKATDSTQKSKRSSSQPSLQAFKEYICIEGTQLKKTSNALAAFFQTNLLQNE